MASTFSNTGLELIATGEQSGTWGSTTNTNLQIIDRLTNGVGAISLTGTTHTLTTTNSGSATLSDGQYAVLVFGGTPSGTNTVTISPNSIQHVYIVKNNSGQSVVLTQGSGGNVTVANGKSAIVYADGAGAGAAVVDVTNTFNFQPLTATLTAIGALAVTDGNIIVGDGSTWVAESGATARTSLGLAIGTNVQAYDADLAAIASLAVTDGNFIVGNGSTWVAENGNTAIASLGVTATAAELNLIDGSVAGTIVNSKAVVYGASGEVNATTLQIGGASITASAAELNYNDITTLGTSQASKVVTADASGDVTLSEELKAKSYNETYATASSSSGSLTIDCETGNVFQVTLTENVTSTTFSNPPASGTAYGFTLRVIQDSTARTIAWPAAVDWAAATAPTLSSGSGDVDVFVFFTTDGGTTWYGFTAGQGLS